MKQGIILGDVSDKGSPITTMFISKSKEMAAIMLGESDGTGSIDKESNEKNKNNYLRFLYYNQ